MNMKNYNPSMEESVMSDINEMFHGDKYDDGKLERLSKMRNICREVAEIDSSVSAPMIPFTTESRNASVKLELKNPFWTARKGVRQRIALLFDLADDTAVAIVDGTDTIRMTFGVQDMWVEWHYDDPIK